MAKDLLNLYLAYHGQTRQRPTPILLALTEQ